MGPESQTRGSTELACPHCQPDMSPDSTADWFRSGGPWAAMSRLHGGDHHANRAWMDHCYRLRLADGRWAYIAEPYHLDAEALRDLAWLTENGFYVLITAGRALHMPGHSISVRIEEE